MKLRLPLTSLYCNAILRLQITPLKAPYTLFPMTPHKFPRLTSSLTTFHLFSSHCLIKNQLTFATQPFRPLLWCRRSWGEFLQQTWPVLPERSKREKKTGRRREKAGSDEGNELDALHSWPVPLFRPAGPTPSSPSRKLRRFRR